VNVGGLAPWTLSTWPGGRLDPVFGFGHIGNGRIWVSGFGPDARGVELVAYDVGAGRTVAIDSAPPNSTKGEFGFFVPGPDPMDENPIPLRVPWTQLSSMPFGMVWTAPLRFCPAQLYDTGQLLLRVPGPANIDALGKWAWYDGLLYYGTTLAYPDEIAYVSGAFLPGQTYQVRVWVTPAGFVESLACDETITWNAQFRRTDTQLLEVYLPGVFMDALVMKDILRGWGWALADLYALDDDVLNQFHVEQATWSLPWWERVLAFPTQPSLSIKDRSAQLAAHAHQRAGSRDGFLALMASLVGGPVQLTDQWSIHRVGIRLPTFDTALRALMDAEIARFKPAGLQVQVSYGGFVAGISKAGDSL
jgi:Uncharacterised protein conserved in bacteria (DUF2313)